MSHNVSSTKKPMVPAIVYKVEYLNSQHIICKVLKNSNITENDEDYENIPEHVQKKIEKLIREKHLNCKRFKNPKIIFETAHSTPNSAQLENVQSDSSYSMANYSEPKITRYLVSHRSGGGCSDNYSTKSNANAYPTALRCACRKNSSNALRFDKRDGYDTENSNYQSKCCCKKGAQNYNFDTTNLYAFQRRHDEAQTDSVHTKDFCQNTHRSKESVARSKTRNVCCGTNVARVCKGIQTNANELKNNKFANCDKQDALSNTSQCAQKLQTSGKDNCEEISEKLEFFKDNDQQVRRFSYCSVTKRNSNAEGVKKRLSIPDTFDKMSKRSSSKAQYGGADDNDYYMGILNNSASELEEQQQNTLEDCSFGEDTYFIRLKRRGSEYTNHLGSANSSEIFELQIPTTKSNRLVKNASQYSRKQLRISGGNQMLPQTHYTSSSTATETAQNSCRKRNRKKCQRVTKEALLYEYNYRRKYTSTDSCT